MLDNQLDSIKNKFIKYLDSLGLSPKSHKNYRSDLTHFTGWVLLKIRSFGSYVENISEAVPFLSASIASEYKNYLIENKIATKTINRRLSTLRHLSRFLLDIQMTDSDFMNGVENITSTKIASAKDHPAINQFRAYLETEKVSPNTIKNYLSDIKQFMTWLESYNKNLTIQK